MIFKETDRFDVIGHNIQYLIDSIDNGMVYYHTIGEFHTNPKSEIMSVFRFNEMLEMDIIKKI
jgi:hypothetical protein